VCVYIVYYIISVYLDLFNTAADGWQLLIILRYNFLNRQRPKRDTIDSSRYKYVGKSIKIKQCKTQFNIILLDIIVGMIIIIAADFFFKWFFSTCESVNRKFMTYCQLGWHCRCLSILFSFSHPVIHAPPTSTTNTDNLLFVTEKRWRIN